MPFPYRVPKNTVVNDILNYRPSPTVQDIVALGSKAARALILTSRIESTGEAFPDHIRAPKDAYVSGSNVGYKEEIETRRAESEQQFSVPALSDVIQPNRIYLVDYDFQPNDQGRPRFVQLPFYPTQIEVEPSSNFVGIMTLGRNVSKYQFTGGEDSIQFEIDWHSFEEGRRDVLRHCKWLEAMSKADGYDGEPHRLMIVWGENPVMFRDDLWVVEKAPYRILDWKAQGIERGQYDQPSNRYRKGTPFNTHSLPAQAYQKVTLKKISQRNLTSADIGDYERLRQ